jgi:methionyl-tRNA formyltransferase
MGTPEFAVASLDAIHLHSSHKIVGVVTVPDKPSGRGQQVKPSAVKKYAIEHQLSVLQPEKLKDPVFLQQLESWQADIFVVVAFRMLPAEAWTMPPLKTINLHGSLLPQYRGAAPINHAIINGETETGVTTFFIDETIDTGKIVFSEKMSIGGDEDAGSLHDRMKMIGAELVVKTLDAMAQGNMNPFSQEQIAFSDKETLKPAPKIHPADCVIDWNRSIVDIYNKIRGLSPYPAAFTRLKNETGTVRTLKIYKAKPTNNTSTGSLTAGPVTIFSKNAPGTVMVSIDKKQCFIAAKNGWIELLEVQIDGKKRMNTDDFMRGFDIATYMAF